jgi:beta-galactosidase
VPRYGAYKGVSWWSKAIDIPASAKGKRVMLNIRGARLRAEVFLNEQLVGYSIMSELPIAAT